ncbi:MAG TPA: LemA family protein [Candidatus Limnocylindrales bacterium]|nr:LemA family protein [Candidatus Limnocylindrales bacterium]
MSGVAAGLGILLLGGVVLFLAVTTFNSVVNLRQQIDKAWANIDVALQQRHDELPRLVDAVRGVMEFERDTFTAVAQARAHYDRTAPIPAQAATSRETTAAVAALLNVVERYPQLASHENAIDLQREIARLEGVLADRREVYNDSVYRYNTRIRTFPTNMLASMFGWQQRPFFSAPDAAGPPPQVL